LPDRIAAVWTLCPSAAKAESILLALRRG